MTELRFSHLNRPSGKWLATMTVLGEFAPHGTVVCGLGDGIAAPGLACLRPILQLPSNICFEASKVE